MYGFVSAASVSSNLVAKKAVSSQRRAVVSSNKRVQPKMMVNEAAASLQLAEGMTVSFGAYLAVFLGTLIPVAFLIILFIQSEARKAGEKTGRASSADE
eukprot:CAMPEP_0184696400 /NCGR_PEP_ID=MMETSP0313-20130426/3711_1 /TAXON_ID=2792 /ORGANISM="Porphyridium aerugineum, Strain SAG 1380-2" /LENGTH=98 /DNA_ID=CAMNT_0027155025 /DNA_START=104 /DNA_END=400 /DNA_ORIENTATION=-